MKNILKIFMALTLLIYSTSCEDFLDINDDPNNPTDVNIDLVFPAACASSCYAFGGFYQILGGIWAQHWTQSKGASQYGDWDAYRIDKSNFGTQYRELYAGSLKDLEYVRQKAKSDGDYKYYFMATVLRVYNFQMLADMYDKVPYSEALRADIDNVYPKFDEGSDIYDGLIEELEEAMNEELYPIQSSEGLQPDADDIFFNGNMDNWVAFANTLKLKLYLRQRYARESVTSAGIQAMVDPTFLTTDVAMTQFAAEQNRRNPCYETGVDRLPGNLSASFTLLNYLVENNDPRLDAIFNPPSNGSEHYGLYQGSYLSAEVAGIAELSTPVLGPVDPVYLMSAPESYFLQAEAALAGWLNGDAESLYYAGIDASFARFGVTGDAASVYPFPTSGTDEEKLEAIITQKWVALANSQGLEAWFERNRTGYPAKSAVDPFKDANFDTEYVASHFTVSPQSAIGDRLPRRLIWPESEYNTNAANYPEGEWWVYDKVWWDVKNY